FSSFARFSLLLSLFLFCLRLRPPPRPTLFPYTTLFRSHPRAASGGASRHRSSLAATAAGVGPPGDRRAARHGAQPPTGAGEAGGLRRRGAIRRGAGSRSSP